MSRELSKERYEELIHQVHEEAAAQGVTPDQLTNCTLDGFSKLTKKMHMMTVAYYCGWCRGVNLDGDPPKYFDFIKRYAKNSGVKEEELGDYSLPLRLTRSERLQGLIKRAYFRGCIRGVKTIREARTPIVLR